MRITLFQRAVLVKYAKLIFGNNSHVFLFGSRIDDNKKGGDIDVLIKTEQKNEIINNLFEKKIEYLISVKKIIGDRKIDLLLDSGLSSKKKFINEIYENCIAL